MPHDDDTAGSLLLFVTELAVLADETAICRLLLVVMAPEAPGDVPGLTEVIAVGAPRDLHLGKHVGAIEPLPGLDGLGKKIGLRGGLTLVEVRQVRRDAGQGSAFVRVRRGQRRDEL